MTTPKVTTPIDLAPAENLIDRFADIFQTFDAGEDLFTFDAFFDSNIPVWRFQLQGAGAFTSQLKSVVEGQVRIDVLATVPTATVFVKEHEDHQDVGGHDLTARRLWLCEVREERITEAVGYCSGEWAEELRARHAVEGSLLRP